MHPYLEKRGKISSLNSFCVHIHVGLVQCGNVPGAPQVTKWYICSYFLHVLTGYASWREACASKMFINVTFKMIILVSVEKCKFHVINLLFTKAYNQPVEIQFSELFLDHCC